MAKKDTKPSPKTVSVPWIEANRAGVSEVAETLAHALDQENSPHRKRKQTLEDKDAQRLRTQFSAANQVRGTALKAMNDLADNMGIKDPRNAVIVADMKKWGRAAAKISAGNRNMDDLGRGRILVDHPEEVEEFYTISSAKTPNGKLPAIRSQKVRVVDDSFDDYLKTPSRNGYAGSINFNIEVELPKNRRGIFEIQIMPRDYQETYDQSHRLYQMIRNMQEIPEAWRTDQQNEVLNTLVRANHALFEEAAIRYGFDDLRGGKPFESISKEDLRHHNDVLDRVRTAIERLPGRRLKWRKETMDAISMAKTSLMNLHFAGQEHAHESDYDPRRP